MAPAHGTSHQRPEPAPRVPGAARILGVDPGLTRCGFGLVDMTANRKAHLVNVGVAGSTPTSPTPWRLSEFLPRSRSTP